MKRKFWLTRHAVQTKFMLIQVLSMSLPSILLAGSLYFLLFTLMAQELALPEGVYEVLIPAFKKVNWVILLGLPAVFGALILWALRMTNSFAGPIERLESDLDEILEGNTKKRLILRKTDDLWGVSERINRLLDRQTGGK